MATDLDQKPYITELFVPMDCNGCAQRIKRVIERIHGVHNVNIDVRQHKITVVGRVDPEALKKAIKKTRKMAVISSHIEQRDSEPQPEAPSPTEAITERETQDPTNTLEQKVADDAQMVHDYPYNNNMIKELWRNHPNMTHEAPYYTTLTYNNYNQLPYLTEHWYLQLPPPQMTFSNGYNQNPAAEEEYYQSRRSDGNNMNSMFSDENPNACIIV